MMLLQGTSIAGTPLQNASSKASRYILLDSIMPQTPGPCPSAGQVGPGFQAMSQQAAAQSPLTPDVPGSKEVTQASLETNPHLPKTALVAGEESFVLTTTMVKTPPTW